MSTNTLRRYMPVRKRAAPETAPTKQLSKNKKQKSDTEDEADVQISAPKKAQQNVIVLPIPSQPRVAAVKVGRVTRSAAANVNAAQVSNSIPAKSREVSVSQPHDVPQALHSLSSAPKKDDSMMATQPITAAELATEIEPIATQAAPKQQTIERAQEMDVEQQSQAGPSSAPEPSPPASRQRGASSRARQLLQMAQAQETQPAPSPAQTRFATPALDALNGYRTTRSSRRAAAPSAPTPVLQPTATPVAHPPASTAAPALIVTAPAPAPVPVPTTAPVINPPPSPCPALAPAPARVNASPVKRFASSPAPTLISPARAAPLASSVASPSPAGAGGDYDDLLNGTRPLLLPEKYRLLDDFFNVLDSTINLHRMRGEVPLFDKIKKSVEQVTLRSFGESQLGQIKRVWEEAYNITRPRLLDKNDKAEYRLVVDFPELSPPAPAPARTAKQPQTSRTGNEAAAEEQAPSDRRHWSTFRIQPEAVLQDRRHSFRQRLEAIVRSHHTEFLLTLPNRPKPKSDPSRIRVWHRDFKLELVPAIEPALLPQPPLALPSASESSLLAKLNSKPIQSAAEKAVAAILARRQETQAQQQPQNIARTLSDPLGIPSSPTSAESPVVIEAHAQAQALLPKELRGLSAGLLEKVKMREEAQKLRLESGIDAIQARRMAVSKLPAVCDMVRSYFCSENRSAVFLPVLVNRLVSTSKTPTNAEEMKRQLEDIVGIVPEWCSLVQVSKEFVFRINRSADFSAARRKVVNSAPSLPQVQAC